MNRAILLIICDFLLLSVLSLARFDKVDEDLQQQTAVAEQPGLDQELADVLKASLEAERRLRLELRQQLAESQRELQARQDLLQQRDQTIADREARIQQTQSALQSQQEQARRIETERAALQSQFASTRTNLAALESQLKSTRTQAAVSSERLAALEADLRRQQEEAARMQQALAEVEKQRAAAESEKQRLATRLQVTETEKRLAQTQIENMKGEVQTVREEKARLQATTSQLAEGVTTLAEKSVELTEEIRQNRPLAANTIFSDFVANRVQTQIHAYRSGLFGQDVNRSKETKTILVSDGKVTHALLHVEDAPVQFTIPGANWESLGGALRRGAAHVPVSQLSFLAADPRIVAIPLTAQQAQSLGTKIYELPLDPYKFSEAVLIGGNEGYYGECQFQLDPAMPGYVKMERRFFKRLAGEFSPSRGDLVFSKNGHLLGVMVNNEYCALISSFEALRTLRTGTSLTTQPTGEVLAFMRHYLNQLPLKLQ